MLHHAVSFYFCPLQGSLGHKQALDTRIMDGGHHIAQHCPFVADAPDGGVVAVLPQESNVMTGNLTVFTQVCFEGDVSVACGCAREYSTTTTA